MMRWRNFPSLLGVFFVGTNVVSIAFANAVLLVSVKVAISVTFANAVQIYVGNKTFANAEFHYVGK